MQPILPTAIQIRSGRQSTARGCPDRHQDADAEDDAHSDPNREGKSNFMEQM